MSIELLLDRFGQSSKFRKKSKKKFTDIQQSTPHRPYDVFSRSSRRRPENVFRTSPGWSHRIFTGRPGDQYLSAGCLFQHLKCQILFQHLLQYLCKYHRILHETFCIHITKFSIFDIFWFYIIIPKFIHYSFT